MQTDTGISFLHFNADVIPKSDAQKRFEATFDRNVTMNETRTILLRYKHVNSNGDAKVLAENSNYSLPNLLLSQTRMKPSYKPSSNIKKENSVNMAAPFTIMSYRPEKVENFDNRRPFLKGQPSNKKGKGLKAVPSTHQTRWKARSTGISSQESFSDPLLKADRSFLARISELAQLEMETVKFEKTKKLKRKKFPDL